MNSYKSWTFKSHLMVGLLFLAATIVVYFMTKPEISVAYLNLWYGLLIVSGILSIILIIRGLTDKKPDK